MSTVLSAVNGGNASHASVDALRSTRHFGLVLLKNFYFWSAQ